MNRPQSLPPERRLRTKRAFDAVFEEGFRATGGLLSILARRGDGETSIGIPCGKRFSKRAVDRNRFRRLVREIFRKHRADWPPGVEIVVLPRCKPEQCDYHRFEKEMLKLVGDALRKSKNAQIARSAAAENTKNNPRPSESAPCSEKS